MLVLSRKPDEVIHIGPDIQIMVVEVRGDKVRLGISAPQDVVIMRGEIVEAEGPAILRNTPPESTGKAA